MLFDPFLKKHRQPGKLLKNPLRSYLRDFLLIFCVVLFRPSFPLFCAGIGLFCAGLFIRLWAKGILRRNETVTTSGPYSFCRHPFYLGNLLLDLSFCLMAGNIILFVIYGPLFLLVYLPTMRGEEEFLLEKFPERYPPLLRLSRLFPRWPRTGEFHAGEWSVRTLLKEREISRLFRILGIAVFFLWMQVLKHAWWEAFEFEGIILLAAALLLQFVGRLVYVAVERAKAHTRLSKRVALNVLLVGIMTCCLTTDALITSKVELDTMVKRDHAQLVSRRSDLLGFLKDRKFTTRYLVEDDVLDQLTPEQKKHFQIQKTFMFDWESYHLLVEQKAPSTANPILK